MSWYQKWVNEYLQKCKRWPEHKRQCGACQHYRPYHNDNDVYYGECLKDHHDKGASCLFGQRCKLFEPNEIYFAAEKNLTGMVPPTMYNVIVGKAHREKAILGDVP